MKVKLCGGTKAYGTSDVLVEPHEEILENFSKRKIAPDGYSAKCKSCTRLYDSQRKRVLDPPKKMVCRLCGETKDADDMTNSSKAKNGKENRCKKCASSQAVEWAKRNRDKDLLKCSKRYAMKKNVTVEDVSREKLVDLHGSGCYICGTETTLDDRYSSSHRQVEHVIPLSRGGDHSYRNCRIVCLRCNTSKYNKTLYELVSKTGLPNTNLDTLLLYLDNAEWHGNYSTQLLQLT